MILSEWVYKTLDFNISIHIATTHATAMIDIYRFTLSLYIGNVVILVLLDVQAFLPYG